MAEQSVMEKMWAGTKHWAKYAGNVVGGAYNAYAGMTDAGIKGASGSKYGITPLPVQAALSAARKLGGGDSLPTVQSTGGAQYVQDLTGIPTQQPDPGFEPAFGFGRGAAMGPNPMGAVAGGAVSAATETYVKDPKMRALIETGVPILGAGVKNATQSLRKGVLRDVGDAPATTIPMDKGRASNLAVVIDDADMLASNSKTADRVNKIRRAHSQAAEDTLRKFVDKSVKSTDPEAGKQAAIGWKKYIEKQETALYKKGEEQFKKAIDIGRGENVIPINPVVKKLDELITEFDSPMHGTIYQDVLKDLKARKAQFDGVDGAEPVQAVKVEELQSQLQTLGKLAYDKSSTAGHVYSQLKKAWDEALEGANHPAAEYLKKAREDYAVDANKLKVLEDQSLSVFFDKGKTGERVLMQPEQIMQKLRSLKPTERQFYVSVMELQDPSAIKALRANIVEDLIEKGKVVGGSARSPLFSPGKFLREFDKRKEDLEFLLPSKADREGFEAVVADLRKASADPNIIKTGTVDATSVAAGAAGMMTGKMGSTGIARGVIHTIENLLTDKDALVDLLYGSQKQPTTLTGRMYNLMRDTAKGSGVTEGLIANRALTAAAGVKTAEMLEPPSPPEGFFDEEAAPEESAEPPPPPEGFFDETVDMDNLLDRIEKAESNGNPNAVSPKGAQGAYQFMPETAKEYGVTDPFNREQAREGARKYMTNLLSQYDGDVKKAVAAYNWGPGNLNKHGLEKAPLETQNYLKKVLEEE